MIVISKKELAKMRLKDKVPITSQVNKVSGSNQKDIQESSKDTFAIQGKKRKSRQKAVEEIDDFSISFCIDIEPQPKERPRTFYDKISMHKAFLASKGSFEVFFSKIKPRTMTPKNTKEFSERVTEAARIAMEGNPFKEIPLSAKIIFCFSGEDGYWPTSVRDGDLDNLEKSLYDALNSVVMKDDCLIVHHDVTKICRKEGGKVFIEIRPAKRDLFISALEKIS